MMVPYKSTPKFLSYRPVLFIMLFLLFFSGIGRNDVPLKEYLQFAKSATFNCVGEVYAVKHNEFMQSCVLIAPRFVLSSAHGFYVDSDSLVRDTITVLGVRYPTMRPHTSRPGEAGSYYIIYNGKRHDAKRIIVHPGYNPDYNSEGFNDIAIIELKEPVALVSPAILYTDSLELNKRGIACGYGEVVKANGKRNLLMSSRSKMAGENMIDSIGGNIINSTYGCLWADMDNPQTTFCNRVGDSAPLPLEWHANGGDCGGGLFIQQKDQWVLAGISFGPSYFSDAKTYEEKYGSYGFIDGWTRISPLAEWIHELCENTGVPR